MKFRGKDIRHIQQVSDDAFRITFIDGSMGYANKEALGLASKDPNKELEAEAFGNIMVKPEQERVMDSRQPIDRDAAREYLREQSGSALSEEELKMFNPMLKHMGEME